MRRVRPLLALLTLLAVAGCKPVPMAPPPAGLRQVHVAAVVNKTGRDLVVSGSWDLAALVGAPKRTALDMMHDELERILKDRGFELVSAGGSADTLTVTVSRFEVPSLPTDFVDGAVAAKLTTPDGATVWSAGRDPWVIPTRGAVTVADAWGMAAKEVARMLLIGWEPPAAGR